MITFFEWISSQPKGQDDLQGLYRSLSRPEDLQRREELLRGIEAAYQRGDHHAADDLDAELEELEARMDSRLHDMDDGDATEDRGEEQADLDRDWSPQEELARVYDQYINGRLHLPDHETVEVDPSYRDDPEWQRKSRSQGYGLAPKGAFQQRPISPSKALADVLRGAILDAPNAHHYGVKYDLVKSMGNEQIIAAAKDAWEWRRGLRDRMRAP